MKTIKDKERRKAREDFAITAASISIAGIIVLIVIMILFSSCTTTQKSSTIYGNQNSHCDP